MRAATTPIGGNTGGAAKCQQRRPVCVRRLHRSEAIRAALLTFSSQNVIVPNIPMSKYATVAPLSIELVPDRLNRISASISGASAGLGYRAERRDIEAGFIRGMSSRFECGPVTSEDSTACQGDIVAALKSLEDENAK